MYHLKLKEMELEFRDKNGLYKFTLHGLLAKSVIEFLTSHPEMMKEKRKSKNGKEWIVLTPILEKGVGFKSDTFETIIYFGDYLYLK